MHGRTDVLITVSFVSSVLSAFGSLFIISNWLLFPSRRIFFTKLIVCLSVANLISSAAYSLSFFSRGSVDASNALCRTQAVLTITFEMASVLWTDHANVMRQQTIDPQEIDVKPLRWVSEIVADGSEIRSLSDRRPGLRGSSRILHAPQASPRMRQ